MSRRGVALVGLTAAVLFALLPLAHDAAHAWTGTPHHALTCPFAALGQALPVAAVAAVSATVLLGSPRLDRGAVHAPAFAHPASRPRAPPVF